MKIPFTVYIYMTPYIPMQMYTLYFVHEITEMCIHKCLRKTRKCALIPRFTSCLAFHVSMFYDIIE